MPPYRFVQILLWGFLATLVTQASAQILSDRFFIEARFQTTAYIGERQVANANGLDRLFSSLGFGPAFSLGYTLNSDWNVVGEWSTSGYPGIITNEVNLPVIFSKDSRNQRTSLLAEIRYGFQSILFFKPFLSSGLGVAFGQINKERRKGWGPLLGFGLDVSALGLDRFGYLRQHYVYPDNALDLAGTGTQFDVLTSASVGLRYTFKKKIPGLGNIVASGPSTIRRGSEAVFTVSTDLDPLEYTATWEMGDGSQKTGQPIRHAYTKPGTYQVKALVSNAKESSTANLHVVVEQTYAPVTIISVSNVPTSPRVKESVSLTPVIRGNDFTCTWTFGDGGASDECETSHSYSQPGGFRITLSVSNPEHSAQFSQSILIQSDVCADLPPLSTVYFKRNSAELTLEMRQLLRSNMTASSACTDRMIEVYGAAIDNERNAEELASERTASVIQYYLNLGISSSRVRSGIPKVLIESELEQLPWTSRNVTSLLINPDL